MTSTSGLKRRVARLAPPEEPGKVYSIIVDDCDDNEAAIEAELKAQGIERQDGDMVIARVIIDPKDWENGKRKRESSES